MQVSPNHQPDFCTVSLLWSKSLKTKTWTRYWKFIFLYVFLLLKKRRLDIREIKVGKGGKMIAESQKVQS